MHRKWSSTYWGALLTRAESWELVLADDSVVISKGERTFSAPLEAVRNVRVTHGLIWSRISFPRKGGRTEDLGGIPKPAALDLEKTLKGALRAYEHERDMRQFMEELDEQLIPIRGWYQEYVKTVARHAREQRWITEETIQALEARRPSCVYRGRDLRTLLAEPEIQQRLQRLPQESQNAIDHWTGDIRSYVEQINARFMEAELVRRKAFFDAIERSPLTGEQAQAVVCFDNRVQAIAAAGSGKTSTLVAKAGYAVHRGLVSPERILLLAFNKDVAKELKARLNEALTTARLSPDGIEVRTIHAFGLDVIGQATGKKPSLATGLEQDGGIKRLAAIIDDLKDADRGFRARWDLFRLVFARDLPPFGKEAEEAEDWDPNNQKAGFRTLNGEVVKSQGERLIADWLFYNGVTYVYEPAYEHDTADATHRQYHPDFYYPDAGLYHEHLALDGQGNPPPEFDGYLAGVEWKRELHAHHGTDLVETTAAELWSGEAFGKLEEALTARGIALDPNPDRPIPGREPIEHEALVKLFRTFLTHAKGNQLSDQDLRDRLDAEGAASFRYRHRRFLDLFVEIRAAWERRLRDEGVIDFEDMLSLAADHIEGGRWESPFQLVMVDEFQDASRARARLVRALVDRPGRHLFTVGDDWQSIYRFAGSDISVMTDFEQWFGPSQQCHLAHTFRCPQWLCDVSSAFVMKNPAQIPKTVVSTREEATPRLQAFQVDDQRDLQGAMDAYLTTLYEEAGDTPAESTGTARPTVYVLGRYNADRELLPNRLDERFADRLVVRFSTVHSAKGLEADHVVIPRLKRGAFGFPSNIEDDPVLHLAMPPDDQVRNAEERRLFYVALTRAKQSLALFTISHQPSPFLVELTKEHSIEVVHATSGRASDVVPCPRCERGALVERKGRYGKFLGCTSFPACRYTSALGRSPSKPQARTRRQFRN